MDRGGEARAAMLSAVDVVEAMLAADPTDARAFNDTRMAHSFVGDALRIEHQGEAALTHYRMALELAEKESATAEPNLVTTENLVMAHHRMARGLIEAGKPEEALTQVALAFKSLADAEKLSPGLVRWPGWHDGLDRARALAYSRQKKWEEAISAYRAEVADNREILKRQPKDDATWNDLRRAYSEMTDCFEALEQWSNAAQSMEGVLECLEQMASRRPLRTAEEAERRSGLEKIAQWKAK